MTYSFSDKLAELRPSAIREIFKSLTDPDVISFAAGNPSPESFPVEALSALSADIFAQTPAAALQYSITEGYAPLREAVAARQKEKFGIGRDFDGTIIVSGGQQGIELACKTFCNEGDIVLCEEPSFIGALNAFRSNGATPVGVKCDGEGIVIADLEEKLCRYSRAKLLYIIPTFQNPTGITTPIERRRAVYDLCLRHGVVILEDNPYGELRFSGADVPTIKSFDTEGIVIYCSSFSKILSAGMRVGYVTAPQAIISKMVVAKQSEDVHTNIFFQMLCHRYMTAYDLDAHIAEIRALYGRKCALMLDCLGSCLPAEVKFTHPEGGLFVWCTMPRGIDSADFAKALVARKVAVVPGATFLSDTAGISHSFRLNYSMPSDEEIVRGVEILGACAGEYIDTHRV